MNRTFLYIICLFLFIGHKASSNNISGGNSAGAFDFEASYLGDFYWNMDGGIRNGAGFLGMANLKLGFETERAGWWKGGRFFVNGATTHGKSPSENYTGDFQVVSNIDAGDLIYLHEVWFRQQFENISLIIGIQDLNVDFVSCDNASLFLNSSFGIPPVISDNVPVPIFPLTGLGISANWMISEKISCLAAVFEGNPTEFEFDKYNTNWSFRREDGLLSITEFQFLDMIGKNPSIVKAGAYLHSGSLAKFDEAGNELSGGRNYGFYLLADKNLWQSNTEDKRLDMFVQVAVSPGKLNNHNLYIGGGFNYYGIFKPERGDVMGLAVANANFHNRLHKHETTIELFYKTNLNPIISIQPDIQYVISPAGGEQKLKNALIGFLRLGIQF
jgi:porin